MKQFRTLNITEHSTRIVLVLSALMLSIIPSCHRLSDSNDADHRLIVFLTRNSPTTYFFDKDGDEAGFEYDLAIDFASFAGKEIEFKVFDSTSEILQRLMMNDGHIAAAGLTRTKLRNKIFSFGPDYLSVEQYVVCHPSLNVKRTIDLIGKTISVAAETSYVQILEKLQKDIPGIRWSTTSEFTTELLLERIAEGQLECTLTDSNVFKRINHSLPNLRYSFSLPEKHFHAWPIAPAHRTLKKDLDTWFADLTRSGRLESLINKHYGDVSEFDYYDIRVFRKNIVDRLPKYWPAIEEAALVNDLEPKLLAALAYQESHWNPKSRSKTGVRGFMMLTQATALDLGVKNRLDPYQSIEGGAKYLRQLIDRLPHFIPQKDRLWMALAAYNLGYGHLQDGRRLAIDEGLNPNRWSDLKKVLPKLARPQYYKRTRYGYARGYEAVAYVKRVRGYLAILKEIDLPSPLRASFRNERLSPL